MQEHDANGAGRASTDDDTGKSHQCIADTPSAALPARTSLRILLLLLLLGNMLHVTGHKWLVIGDHALHVCSRQAITPRSRRACEE